MYQIMINLVSKVQQMTAKARIRRIFFILLVALIMTGIVLGLVGTTITARTVPTFSIVSVVINDTVTIRTYNYPASHDFTVRMHYIGTKGIGGTVVGTTNSGSGGSFDVTYSIPDYLKGQAQIAIRMDSTSGSFFAYNWFYNDTTGPTVTPGGPTITPGGPTHTPGFSGIPTFSIKSEIVDTSVTIHTSNFPASQTFTVRMHYKGTKGIGGTVVATTDSGSGGSQDFTYTIPDYLKSQAQIAIRMDSSEGFYAYNWFNNQNYP